MKKYLKYIESSEDFPKPGVIFWDFTPLHQNPKVFRNAINDIAKHFRKKKITKIAAIEAKGFVLGGALALEMKRPLTLIRKVGLTPGKILSETFVKEYGQGEYQIKHNIFNKKDSVLIVYDIIAGKGAVGAAINLVEKSGAKVSGIATVIELEYLKGREGLPSYDIFSLVKIKDKKLK